MAVKTGWTKLTEINLIRLQLIILTKTPLVIGNYAS